MRGSARRALTVDPSTHSTCWQMPSPSSELWCVVSPRITTWITGVLMHLFPRLQDLVFGCVLPPSALALSPVLLGTRIHILIIIYMLVYETLVTAAFARFNSTISTANEKSARLEYSTLRKCQSSQYRDIDTAKLTQPYYTKAFHYKRVRILVHIRSQSEVRGRKGEGTFT